MKLRSKIIIACLVILIFSIVFSIIIQYVFQKKEEKQLETSLNETAKQTSLSTNETAQIKKVVNENIQFPSYNLNTQNLYYYNWSKNKLYKTDLKTQKSTALMPFEEIIDVSDMQWNTESEKVVIKYLEGNTKIYDIKANNSADLDSSFINLAWLPDDRLITNFHNDNSQINKLIIINAKGEIIENLLNLQSNSEAYFFDFVGYQNNEVYYLLGEPANYYYLYKQNLTTKDNRKVVDQSVVNAKLSPNKQQILYNTYKDLQFANYFFDNNKNESRQLNINTDLDNILWGNDSKSLFLISGSLETNEEGQNYYYKIIDKIEKYNLENSQIELSIDVINQGRYGAENLFLSENDEKLYFVNFAADSNLYSIKLK